MVAPRLLPWRNRRALCTGPVHDRNAADAVLRATFDDPVAIAHVYQHVALAVEEADHLKRLEQETAPLVENTLSVLQFASDLDWADLTTCNAGVAGVLGDTQSAL